MSDKTFSQIHENDHNADDGKMDTISIQAAIDRINKQREHLRPDIYGQDYIGDAAYKICADFIGRLPSAQPERKRGKWINVNEGKWNVLEVLKCSACGEIDNRMYKTDSYCPNCGADMRGEQDE